MTTWPPKSRAPIVFALLTLALALLVLLDKALTARPLPAAASPAQRLRAADGAPLPPLPWRALPASTTRIHPDTAPAVPPWCAGVRSSPTLTPAERALAAAFVARAREVFEWGCGSSTLAARALGVARITSVDTVAGALACVLVAGGLHAGMGDNFTALHVEVHGEHGEFGNPVDAGARSAWPDVSGAILLHPAPQAIDVVLVDGRFRAASILKAASVVRSDAVILVHDWDTRPAYHAGVTAGMLEVVGAAERLVALRRTEASHRQSPQAWAALWAAAEYDQS